MKQETLEEVAMEFWRNDSSMSDYVQQAYITAFKAGAKWQEERMYIDMQEYAEFCIRCYENKLPCIIAKDWFEQFKNETK